MTKLEIELPDINATIELAQLIAKQIDKTDSICLRGDLGTGKTTFARILISALAGSEIEVLSPTFTLVQPYDLPNFTIWHYDLYRLKNFNEIYELSIEDALFDISIIEWPEIIENILSENRLDIYFSFSDKEDSRKALLVPFGKWHSKILTIKF